MATLEQRIIALERTHGDKDFTNVFVRRFDEEVPITRVEYGGLIIEKLPDESEDEFKGRAVKEVQHLPCNGTERMFFLRLAGYPGFRPSASHQGS